MKRGEWNMLPGISSTALTVLGFIFVTEIVKGIYAAQNMEPPGGFVLLQYVVLVCLIGNWLRKDSRIYQVRWLFDMGFFLYLAWPLIVPIYLFKTRKIKAVGILLGLLGIYIGSWIVGTMLSVMFLS